MTPQELLLIDDDVHASVLRKRVLETKGYHVQLALDAASGIALAGALRPTLIILDHHIPPMYGPEVMRQLRAVLPTTPVISLGGYTSLAPLTTPSPTPT